MNQNTQLSKEQKIQRINEINASNLTPQAKLDAMEKFLDDQEALDTQAQQDIKAQNSVQKVELVGAELATIKGIQGDEGIVGPKGDKGETGPEGKPGKDSKVKGPKGDPGKDGKDGISPDYTTLAIEASKLAQDRLSPFIPTVEQLAKEVPITGNKARDALESLQGEERLEASAINNLTNITVSETAPENPKYGDLWYDLSVHL